MARDLTDLLGTDRLARHIGTGTLDPVSRNLLPILRHFVEALQTPSSAGWRVAYATAVEIWGEARGLAIAHRMQAFVAAVLQNRPVPLHCNPPPDIDARDTLTEDETLMIALLRHMRADQTASARMTVQALAAGRTPSAVVRAGLVLRDILDGPQQAPRAPIRARLSLVK